MKTGFIGEISQVIICRFKALQLLIGHGTDLAEIIVWFFLISAKYIVWL